MGRIAFFFVTLFLLKSREAAAQLSLKPGVDTIAKKISLKVLPQNFYNQHMGYFCRKEVQLQKLTSLPVFIRLGSKDYVDYLEKKPNAIKKD
jgi:hypothetical protein